MASIEASVGIARKAPGTVKDKVIHTPDIKKAPEVGDNSPFGRFAKYILQRNHLMSITVPLRFT